MKPIFRRHTKRGHRNSSSSPMKPATELKRLTDQCVMCGMCLPHCHTYHLTRDEAETPRGLTRSRARHLHQRYDATAEAPARRNVEAFGRTKLDAIFSVSSGCGATLADYAHSAHALGAPVRDISDFMNSITWPASVQLATLPKKVAVHDFCTLIF